MQTEKTAEQALSSSELQLRESREGDRIRLEYLNGAGVITYAQDLHYAAVVETVDEEGHVLLEQYFDEKGNPEKQPEGHYALSRTYDQNGNNTIIEYLDKNGKPVLNTSGYAFRLRIYNEKGQALQDRYYDTEWNPVEVSTGNYAILRFYDKEGNNNVIRYLGENDEPVLIKSGFAKVVRSFDEKGRVLSEMYYGTEDEPIAIGLGQYGEAYLYDNQNQKIQITYLDRYGNPMRNSRGYATVKRTFTEDGDLETEMYYDASGAPVKAQNKAYGVRYTEEGEQIYLDIYGNSEIQLSDYLYDHPYYIIIAAFLLCFAAVLLPGKLRLLLLVLYVLFIVYMTLLLRESGDPKGEYEFFWSYRQFFTSSYYRTEILENIWLFIPFGALLYSLLGQNADKIPSHSFRSSSELQDFRPGMCQKSFWYKLLEPRRVWILALLITFLMSCLIELIQLVFGLGLFEFDDMISNTLGGLFGYMIAFVLSTLIPDRSRKNQESDSNLTGIN